MNLVDCEVHLMDYTAQVQVDDCINCKIFIGPVVGSAFFRDCSNCTVTVACNQVNPVPSSPFPHLSLTLVVQAIHPRHDTCGHSTPARASSVTHTLARARMLAHQFRTRDCRDLRVSLYCSSNPSIETTSGLTLSSWNGAYPGLTSHFEKAKLDPANNTWQAVYDFNQGEEVHGAITHWAFAEAMEPWYDDPP